MNRLLTLLTGGGWCPACDSEMQLAEPGYHQCKRCGVVADYDRGYWSYAGSAVRRRLPGLAGLPYREEQPV